MKTAAAKSPAPEGDQTNETPLDDKLEGQEPTQEEPKEPEDADDTPEDKAEKAEKAKAKLPLSELLKDPQYAAQHGKMLAQHRKTTEAEVKKRLEAEAAESAKRANMAEVDRLKAELKDSEDARVKLAAEMRGVAVDRDINRVLIEGEVRLQEGALDILRDKVLAAVKDEDEPDYADAVSKVLDKLPWMRASKAKEEPPEREEAASKQEPRQPGARKGTQSPAQPEVKKGVDVMKMSPQEYAKHRRDKGLT